VVFGSRLAKSDRVVGTTGCFGERAPCPHAFEAVASADTEEGCREDGPACRFEASNPASSPTDSRERVIRPFHFGGRPRCSNNDDRLVGCWAGNAGCRTPERNGRAVTFGWQTRPNEFVAALGSELAGTGSGKWILRAGSVEGDENLGRMFGIRPARVGWKGYEPVIGCRSSRERSRP
jgi:hypothetical protein